MAVQKSRKTRSRSGMRRAHDSIKTPKLSEDAASRETHFRHHLTPDGHYRGVQYVEPKPRKADEEAEAQE